MLHHEKWLLQQVFHLNRFVGQRQSRDEPRSASRSSFGMKLRPNRPSGPLDPLASRYEENPHDCRLVTKAGFLRILLVIDYKLGFLGGAQTAFMQQAVALAAAGHRVTIAAPDASRQHQLAASGILGWDAPALVFIGDLPTICNSPRTRQLLRDKMDAWETDLVIVHSEFGLAVAALQVAAERGIPSMHTVHTFFWQGPRGAGFAAPLVTAAHALATGLGPARRRLAPARLDTALRGMTLVVAQTADVVISPSRHQAAALRSAGVARVAVISNTSSGRQGAPLVAAPGPLRLVWAARFTREKRLEVALDAMLIVEKSLGPGAVHLDVAGGQAPSTAPTSVSFHGRVASTRVTELLEGAHAAVITSHGFDNQPMIALEAFKCGRPVIVSDPTLAVEFGAAAIAAVDATADGIAQTIIRLALQREQLFLSAIAAVSYASDAAPVRHVAHIENAYLALAEEPRRVIHDH